MWGKLNDLLLMNVAEVTMSLAKPGLIKGTALCSLLGSCVLEGVGSCVVRMLK